MSKVIETRARITAEAAGLGAFKKLADAVKGVAQAFKAVEKVKPMADWGDRFQKNLDRLKASSRDIERLKKEWNELNLSMVGKNFRPADWAAKQTAWKDRVLGDL